MAFATSDFSGAPPLTVTQVTESLAAREADPAWVEAAAKPGTTQHGELVAMREFLDGQVGPPAAASAKDYFIPRAEGANPEQAAAFDQSARQWLVAAGYDSRTGTEMAKLLDESLRTPVEHEAGVKALRQAWGDSYETRVAMARRLVAHVEQQAPGLRRFLEETGLGSHPHVVAQLSSHALKVFGE